MVTYRLLFTILHALLWASKDAGDIRAGKSIRHGVRLAMRAGIEVVVSAVVVYVYGRIWPAALLTIACGLLFSAVFRFAINTMRGRDWRYISPSSWYDRFWLSTQDSDNWLMTDESHARFLAHNGPYVGEVHRAGLIAYCFEALMFALLIFLR